MWGNGMSWTEERVELLKQFWGNGMTAAQIAERLGDVSRNAVIGKAHRLGLSQPKKTAPRAPVAAQAPAMKKAPVAPTPAPAAEPMITPKPMPKQPDVRAEDLPWHRRCQWPIGHPGDPEFRFCGEAAAEGKPYCTKHCVMAYRQKEEAA